MNHVNVSNCCGALLGTITIFILVFSIAFPWYFINLKLEWNNESCNILELIGWSEIYCKENCGSKLTNNTLKLCSESYNWREEKNSDNRKFLYNLTVGFLSLTTTLMLIITGSFFLNLCGIFDKKECKNIMSILGVIALITLTFTIIYFPSEHPRTWEKDHQCWKILQNYGPCKNFLGDHKTNILNFKIEYWWGGAGFWIAVAAWIPLFFTLLMTFVWEDYYQYQEIHEHQEKYLPNQYYHFQKY